VALFTYKAKMSNGQVIENQIEADNEAEAVKKLIAQKLQITSIVKVQSGLSKFFTISPKVKTSEVSIFSRQFATMIDAGLPVLQALTILTEQIENKKFKEVLIKIRDDIGNGGNLSDSMGKYPKIFNSLYVNMIKAGELSGKLADILERLSVFLEKAEALRAKIKGAMSYPVTILVIAGIIVILLMVKVVPAFKSIFESFGGKLPPITQAIVFTSEYEQKNYMFQIGAAVLIAFVFNVIKSTDRGAYIIDEIVLRTPIFGDLVKKSTVAAFARTLGTLLQSGVSILDALETVAKASGNKVIEKALLSTRAAVREGKSLTEPLKETKLFPSMVVQMVAVGEETGKLADMLAKMSDFYDAEVDTAVESIMAMIEPLIMSILGVVIGLLVVGMFLPMFSMGSLVS